MAGHEHSQSESENYSESDNDNHDDYDSFENGDDFEKMKEVVYETNKKIIDKQIKQLKKGKQKYYNKMLKQFEAERDVLIKQGEVTKKCQAESINKMLQNELKVINAEFEEKEAVAKTEILATLNERKKTLEEEHNSNELNDEFHDVKFVRKSTRHTATPNRANKRNRKQATGPKIIYILKEHQILEDLKSFSDLKTMRETGKKSVNRRR